MGFKNKPHFQRFSWCCNLFLAILCAITFAVDLYLNIVLCRPKMMGYSYAKDTPIDVLKEHMTQITPASWVLCVWIVLYALLIIWFLYVFYLLICRQACSRDNKPPFFPGFFWFLFIVVNVLNGIWLYLFVHHNLLISGIILLVLMITLYVLSILANSVCWLDISSKNDVSNDGSNGESNGESNDDNIELLECEITLLKMLTLNGIPLYAMWCTVTACLQWAIIFKYSLFHFSDNVSCVIALALLSILLLINWQFELVLQRKYYLFTWLPSFALIAFFIAIIMKHHSIGGLHKPGLFFSFILLVVIGIAMILKCCGICLCYPKSPNPRFSRV